MKREQFSYADFLIFFNGKAVKPNNNGKYPIYGSNGIIGAIGKSLYEDAIILGRVGAYCGSVMRCKNSFWASDNTIVVKTKTEIADMDYCYYMLIDAKLNNYAGGAAQPLITQTILKQRSCFLPSLDTQRHIADILFAYDDLIENNQKQIKLLEEATMRLYKEWFVYLSFPGHEDTEIVDGLPKGWEKLIIDDVCKTVGGGTPSTKVTSFYENGEILWVTPTDITKNNCIVLLDTEKKITENGLKNSSAKILPPDTILMTSRASVGFFALIDKEVCTNQGFISCIPNEENMRMYILYNLINRREEILSKAGGSTYKEISKSIFRQFKIIKPSDDLLNLFYEIVYVYIKQIRVLKKNTLLLREARDKLLPKLMSGKIEV